MFLQQAQGVFTVEVLGENHCGPNHDSPKQFEFDCEVVWPLEALDARGFLLDNLFFHEFFSHIGQTEKSCELLVLDCVERLWSLTHNRAHSIKVGLKPFLGVRIEYTRVREA